MDAEALLGPTPPDHRIEYHDTPQSSLIQKFIHEESGRVMYDDPRLGSLPGDWEFRRNYAPDELAKRLYRNKKTGEVTDNDPRLAPEEFSKRGTPIRRLTLV
jgi:hypothetical protein